MASIPGNLILFATIFLKLKSFNFQGGIEACWQGQGWQQSEQRWARHCIYCIAEHWIMFPIRDLPRTSRINFLGTSGVFGQLFSGFWESSLARDRIPVNSHSWAHFLRMARQWLTSRDCCIDLSSFHGLPKLGWTVSSTDSSSYKYLMILQDIHQKSSTTETKDNLESIWKDTPFDSMSHQSNSWNWPLSADTMHMTACLARGLLGAVRLSFGLCGQCFATVTLTKGAFLKRPRLIHI